MELEAQPRIEEKAAGDSAPAKTSKPNSVVGDTPNAKSLPKSGQEAPQQQQGTKKKIAKETGLPIEPRVNPFTNTTNSPPQKIGAFRQSRTFRAHPNPIIS